MILLALTEFLEGFIREKDHNPGNLPVIGRGLQGKEIQLDRVILLGSGFNGHSVLIFVIHFALAAYQPL